MTENILERVRRALEENPALIVNHVEEGDYLLGREFNKSHRVEFFVAPKIPTRDADKLQEFMVSLVPAIEADDMNDCWAKLEFHFGRLTYLEQLGEEDVTRVFEFSDKDFGAEHGAKNDKLTITERLPIIREITIRVFPSRLIAERVRRGSIFKFFMSRENLDNLVDLELRNLPK